MKDYLSETLNEAKLRFTPFRAWIGDLRDPGIDFYITRPKFKVSEVLKRTGFYDIIGEDYIFARRRDALAAITYKYGDLVDMEHLTYHLPLENEASEVGNKEE